MVRPPASTPSEKDRLLSSNNEPGGGTSTTEQRRPRSRVSVQRGLLIVCGSLLLVAVAIAVLVPVLRHSHHRPPSSQHQSSSDDGGATIRFDGQKANEKGRKYEATQFISFTINTLGGSAEHGECKGRSVDPETGLCYLGNSNNITEDVHQRLRILEEALVRIRDDVFTENNEVDRSSTVLKIFMVPEFFLRGPNGAYSVEDAYDDTENDANDGVLVQYSDRLREIVSNQAFEDYLFVFGTVIVAQELDDHPTKASQVLYYNLAPVMKGGPTTKGGPNDYHFLFQKRYISGADFLSRTTLPNPSDEDLHRYASPWEGLVETAAKRGTKLVEDGNLIDLDGIRIGFEICLDHRLEVLWNDIQSDDDSEPQLVDVQLIVSAGMAIERGPNPLVPGGVVYLSDGEASSAACLRTDSGRFDPDRVCREKPDGLKHVPQGGPGYSEFFPLAACLDMEKSDLLKGYYSLHQTQGCAYTLKKYGIDVMDEFKYYPPSLEIYPTVDLPPPP